MEHEVTIEVPDVVELTARVETLLDSPHLDGPQDTEVIGSSLVSLPPELRLQIWDLLFNLRTRGAQCISIYLDCQPDFLGRLCRCCCDYQTLPHSPDSPPEYSDPHSSAKRSLLLDAHRVSLVCRKFHNETIQSHLLFKINWFGFSDRHSRFMRHIDSLSTLQRDALRSISLRVEMSLTCVDSETQRDGRFNVFWSTISTLQKCHGLQNLFLVLEFLADDVSHRRAPVLGMLNGVEPFYYGPFYYTPRWRFPQIVRAVAHLSGLRSFELGVEVVETRSPRSVVTRWRGKEGVARVVMRNDIGREIETGVGFEGGYGMLEEELRVEMTLPRLIE